MTIDELLEEEGFNSTCDDCPHYDSWDEFHPYGMGYTTEPMGECNCPSENECPRLVNAEQD